MSGGDARYSAMPAQLPVGSLSPDRPNGRTRHPSLGRRAVEAAGSDPLNVRDVASRYHQIPPNEFARYHLGIWTTGAQAWLPDGAWDACARPDITIPDGADVCLGFDGSWTEDSTALVVVSIPANDGVPHLDVAGAWEKPGGAGHEWVVDILEVEETIRQACRRWQVREIATDPYGYRRSYKILEDEGLPIVDYPQSAQLMTPATQAFREADADLGESDDLDRHIDRHAQSRHKSATGFGADSALRTLTRHG
jgi:hypothetical protein